jgi:DNA-binding Lrp family transcriptional regulator
MTTENLKMKLLNVIQQDFPVCGDPYGKLAAELGCNRENIHRAVIQMKKDGIIRRIGGSFDAKKLGYVSALVAARVEPGRIEAVADAINRYPEVTHNYERNGDYNLWFTIIACSTDRIDDIIRELRTEKGLCAIHSLPAQKVFKLKVDFSFK